jgi:hypothetical protein
MSYQKSEEFEIVDCEREMLQAEQKSNAPETLTTQSDNERRVDTEASEPEETHTKPNRVPLHVIFMGSTIGKNYQKAILNHIEKEELQTPHNMRQVCRIAEEDGRAAFSCLLYNECGTLLFDRALELQGLVSFVEYHVVFYVQSPLERPLTLTSKAFALLEGRVKLVPVMDDTIDVVGSARNELNHKCIEYLDGRKVDYFHRGHFMQRDDDDVESSQAELVTLSELTRLNEQSRAKLVSWIGSQNKPPEKQPLRGKLSKMKLYLVSSFFLFLLGIIYMKFLSAHIQTGNALLALPATSEWSEESTSLVEKGSQIGEELESGNASLDRLIVPQPDDNVLVKTDVELKQEIVNSEESGIEYEGTEVELEVVQGSVDQGGSYARFFPILIL